MGLKRWSVGCSVWSLPANQTANLNQIQTSAPSLSLPLASSSLVWGRPQIPAEPAHFFSSVNETQHPEGPKSQWPEINGFAQITWHNRREKLRVSPPFLFPVLSLCSLCLFSCHLPKAHLRLLLLFPDSEVQDGAGGNTSWTENTQQAGTSNLSCSHLSEHCQQQHEDNTENTPRFHHNRLQTHTDI